MNDIEDKLKSIISEYTEENFDHNSATQNFDDLGVDSLSLVEIIFDIEETFDITIPQDNDLNELGSSLNCYADVLQLVKDLVNARQNNA
tara:strand:+ start:300 stop:566 length:267 start_codon:yes stop_codon:yes gene_type:complete